MLVLEQQRTHRHRLPLLFLVPKKDFFYFVIFDGPSTATFTFGPTLTRLQKSSTRNIHFSPAFDYPAAEISSFLGRSDAR
jgi:hypothetical protein